MSAPGPYYNSTTTCTGSTRYNERLNPRLQLLGRQSHHSRFGSQQHPPPPPVVAANYRSSSSASGSQSTSNLPKLKPIREVLELLRDEEEREAEHQTVGFLMKKCHPSDTTAKVLKFYHSSSDNDTIHQYYYDVKRLNLPNVPTRGVWSPEEDALLLKLALKYRERDWRHISEHMTGKASRQCRDRWHNNLNPKIKTSPWTPLEDQTLFRALGKVGKKWSIIAGLLPGRTANAVKNRYTSVSRDNRLATKTKIK